MKKLQARRSYKLFSRHSKAHIAVLSFALLLSSALILAAVSLAPVSSNSGIAESAGPKEASADLFGGPGPRMEIATYYESRHEGWLYSGRVPLRWGVQRYDADGNMTDGYGFRHIEKKHGMPTDNRTYNRIVHDAIQVVLLSPGGVVTSQGGQSKRVVAPVFGCDWRVVYDMRTNTPDGKPFGIVTAFKENENCEENMPYWFRWLWEAQPNNPYMA